MSRKLSAGVLIAALIASLMLAHAQTTKPEAAQSAQSSATSKSRNQAAMHDAQEDGERIFQQNCSRCHNAPDGFSSRISGTVVRHMRVRAGLSHHDAEELLRFLNP